MPSLPQNDSRQARERRERVLAKRKLRYLLNYNHIGPVQFVPILPKGETFTIRYRLRQFLSILRVLLNQAVVVVRHFFSPPRKLEDYRSYYPVLPLPDVAHRYKEDAEFARQRVAGANPMVIRNVKTVDYDAAARMRLSAAQFETAVGKGKTIATETADDRLYLCDYTHLHTVVPGVWDGTQKTFATPLALFHLEGEQRRLVPVAIQLDPADGSGRPVYLPGEGADWLMAKMYVQMADGVDHELTTHLGRTHLVIQPFVMNTNRELPDSHPVYVLLKPHFEGTMAINQAANPDLLAPRGPIAMVFAGTMESNLATAAEGIVEYYKRFFDFAFPRNLELRGVGDPALFPDFPHRDDGALHWAAIETYVGGYVDVYYKFDRDVADDYELQNWIAAMRRGLDLASGGGGVAALPKALQTRDQLKAILAQVRSRGAARMTSKVKPPPNLASTLMILYSLPGIIFTTTEPKTSTAIYRGLMR